MAIYKRKDSPYWWYSFRLPGEGRVSASTGTHDRKLAEQVYIAKRSEYQKIQYGFERKKIKLKSLMDDYLKIYSKYSKATYDIDVYMIERMKKFFGDVFVDEVTVNRIEEYRVRRLNDGVCKATVNRECTLLKSIFNRGIEWNKCKENPVKKIRFYNEEENRRMRFLEQQEKVRLLNVSRPALRRIIFFALNTGMRQGEILNLRWKDINFKTNLIEVRHSKSGRPRFVPMSTELSEMLKSKPSKSEYVFGTPKGKAEWTLYRKPFEKALKDAELTDFRFHDLRHCFASDLVMKGVDLKTVSELLGHASTEMTERYSHLSPEHKRIAVEMLPKGLLCYAGATSGAESDEGKVKNELILENNAGVAQLVEHFLGNAKTAVFENPYNYSLF